MSWMSEIFAEGEWVGNGLRFATEREALNSGCELASRWWVVEDYRATPSTDPVNYRFDAETWKNIRLDK